MTFLESIKLSSRKFRKRQDNVTGESNGDCRLGKKKEKWNRRVKRVNQYKNFITKILTEKEKKKERSRKNL